MDIWIASVYSGNAIEYIYFYVTEYMNWQRFTFLFTIQSMHVWKLLKTLYESPPSWVEKGRQQKVSIICIQLEIIKFLKTLFFTLANLINNWNLALFYLWIGSGCIPEICSQPLPKRFSTFRSVADLFKTGNDQVWMNMEFQ